MPGTILPPSLSLPSQQLALALVIGVTWTVQRLEKPCSCGEQVGLGPGNPHLTKHSSFDYFGLLPKSLL